MADRAFLEPLTKQLANDGNPQYAGQGPDLDDDVPF